MDRLGNNAIMFYCDKKCHIKQMCHKCDTNVTAGGSLTNSKNKHYFGQRRVICCVISERLVNDDLLGHKWVLNESQVVS